jgi:hypothetical protein
LTDRDVCLQPIGAKNGQKPGRARRAWEYRRDFFAGSEFPGSSGAAPTGRTENPNHSFVSCNTENWLCCSAKYNLDKICAAHKYQDVIDVLDIEMRRRGARFCGATGTFSASGLKTRSLRRPRQ